MTTPSTVGNQSLLSEKRAEGGLIWPLHSRFRIPSAVPNTVVSTRGLLPSRQSSKPCRLARKIPLLLLIQKLPRPSS